MCLSPSTGYWLLLDIGYWAIIEHSLHSQKPLIPLHRECNQHHQHQRYYKQLVYPFLPELHRCDQRRERKDRELCAFIGYAIMLYEYIVEHSQQRQHCYQQEELPVIAEIKLFQIDFTGDIAGADDVGAVRKKDPCQDKKVDRVKDNEEKDRQPPLFIRAELVQPPPLLDVKEKYKHDPQKVGPIYPHTIPLMDDIGYTGNDLGNAKA
jgi:hypothetical protein